MCMVCRTVVIECKVGIYVHMYIKYTSYEWKTEKYVYMCTHTDLHL